MKLYKNDDHLRHQSRVELTPGKFIRTLDLAERISRVQAGLPDADTVDCPAASIEELTAIHALDYLDFLATAWPEWSDAFGSDMDGVGFVWPHRNRPPRCPVAIEGKIAYYMFDGVSTITPEMWAATTGAAGAALQSARDLRSTRLPGLVLARPPGHHACKDMGGGTSYTNHTALTAQELSRDGARIAILDIDAHHGNGTQDIFWSRSDVLTVSIHTDPSIDYPYFSGYADEIGAGEGEGFNVNLPLPAGTTWNGYSEAVDTALSRIRDHSPDYVVIALGVDTYVADPAGRLALEYDDFKRLGDAISGISSPHTFVMEGGYNLDAIGTCVKNVVGG